ncbi:YrhB family protein [Saccharopolyspora sp. K220]|uniref:YrhB domain-containing protein n=1 Tax=Saccharopolyspora soli TaxID=2926618 RepID=UPI001F5A60B9|nr:YrhB domain-containing protein [Saccharopolyspora soli]MCI2417468.1 YrhB family protein [Saccharopolyspora soli]
MNKQDVVGIATRFVADQIGPDLIHPSVGKIVIEEEFVGEHELAWTVPFNSVAFLETGDFDKACIPSMIVVPKDGGPAFFPPTSRPVMEFLEDVRESGRKLGAWRDLGTTRPSPDDLPDGGFGDSAGISTSKPAPSTEPEPTEPFRVTARDSG